MLKLSWIEFLLRSIPETFVLMWGIHVISRKSINTWNYVFSSIILSITIFWVRRLPIYFGVHVIINIIITISIVMLIKIPLIKAIYNTFIMYFLLSFSEFLNFVILKLLNIDTSINFSNPYIKCLDGIPSLIIVVLFILIANYLLKMKKEIKKIDN